MRQLLPDYIVQTKDYNCTPTAYANYIEWAGIKVRDKNMYLWYLEQDMGTTEEGTEESAIKNYNFIKRVSFDADYLALNLKAGKAIILQHFDGEDEWHDSFWTRAPFGLWRLGCYLGINVEAGKKYTFCRKKGLAKLLEAGKGRTDGRNVAWITK